MITIKYIYILGAFILLTRNYSRWLKVRATLIGMAFYSTSSFRCSFALSHPKLQPLVSMSLSSKLPLHFSGNARFNRNHVHHYPTALRIRASNSSSSRSGTNLVLLSSTVTVTTAVANRVLYKLALVPMKEYPFFLAQFITFG